VALDAFVEVLGIHWQAKTVDVSPYGAKVALPTYPVELSRGLMAELRLALADGDPPLAIRARVVRTDPDGIVLNFVNLGGVSFARLKDLADSLLGSLPIDPAPAGGKVGVMKDRRRARRTEVALEINFDGDMPHYWRGRTVDLSPFGVKVAWPPTAVQPLWGTGVRLRIASPNGQPPISLKGIVWRRESESVVLLFVEMRQEERERLKVLLERLQAVPV
jgi:hypothetical protein